eukprot:CAMPEP_0170553310 /NCGR_PEP_ID=MMETSP0211-20121228/11130_1 /TAXON_ID=311385 /ORGANISM="Pseudokeronopsis sp., Strain OXSARD2" /LENGTH=130 /DNA_ID=CAMNT_0010861543 /DNA_START=778 /DNA_END=1170 /DNA_ORIENTATION=-
MTYGQIYPNINYDHYTPRDNITSTDFIPVQYTSVEPQFEIQGFISEFTLQEFYYALMNQLDFTLNIMNQTFNSNQVSIVIPSFNESFGSDLNCGLAITAFEPATMNITTGNLEFDPNWYNFTIYEKNFTA